MTQQDPLLLHRKHAAELYLIRHGDAIPGPEEIIPGGVYDNLPLSKEGREQAHRLAERLKKTAFQAAYSSPLRRCLETAAPLLDELQLTPTIVEGLKEILADTPTPSLPTHLQAGDDLTELTRTLQARQQEIARVAASTGHWDELSHVETSKAFRQRVVEAIDAIAHAHIGERVLIFGHAGVINAYVAEVLGLAKDFFFPTVNTSITVVRADTESRVLYILNDVAHLFG